MQRDIRPAWLIRQAEELGGVGAAQGRPRSSDLRRSVSAAYYAIFHRLALATARSALPNAPHHEIYGLARYISHSSIRQVCSYVAGEQPPKHLVAVVQRLRTNAGLARVVNSFVVLQVQREEADYNHLADFTRQETLVLVRGSKQAIALVDLGISSNDFQAFLGLVALRSAIGRA